MKTPSFEFRHAFAGIAAVLSANALSLGLHVYELFPNVDVPLHLAGGYFVGMFALATRDELIRRKKLGRAPWWFDLLFVVGFVAIVAIFWELYEYVMDATYVASHHLPKTQLSLGDTIDDLFNGMIGAAVVFWAHGRTRA